jgi:hypothetical protein
MENLMEHHASHPLPWYRQRWPWLLMAGPFVVVLAASYTFWLAVAKPDALVVGDYYRQGKAINLDLRRDRVATGLGLQMTLAYDAAAGRLVGKLSSSKPITPGLLNLQLVHSTLPEKDLRLSLPLDADGGFSVKLDLLEIARWQVVAEDRQAAWRLAGTWSWPHQKQITLTADAPPHAENAK